MGLLVFGLILFLGPHSIRLWGDGLRSKVMQTWGEGPWKGLYSLASIAGLVLIVQGYGAARMEPSFLWALPVAARHFGSLLVLVAFVFFAAAYVPGTRLKTAVGHPMVLGAGIWAVAHLLSNGTVADLWLFGGFAIWSVAVFFSARRRDAAAGTQYPSIGISRDLIAVGVGAALWCVFAFWLHAAWFGVAPFG